jgi:hypothetical protein
MGYIDSAQPGLWPSNTVQYFNAIFSTLVKKKVIYKII